METPQTEMFDITQEITAYRLIPGVVYEEDGSTARPGVIVKLQVLDTARKPGTSFHTVMHLKPELFLQFAASVAVLAEALPGFVANPPASPPTTQTRQ